MESYNLQIKLINHYTPKKLKSSEVIHKPHVDKDLREAIMKNPYLKTKKNELKNPSDIFE